MVKVEWRLSLTRFRVWFLCRSFGNCWKKWRQDDLRGSVEHSERKGGESVVAISMFLCGSPRLCQLRTEGLVPVSKYWMYRSHAGDMGPVSLVAYHRQKLSISLMLHWWAWERNWVWTHRSASRRDVNCIRSPFSREQWNPSKSIDDSWKVVIYGDCPQEAYARRTWTGVGSVHVVLIRFSPVWCTSIRITATLGYE
jgi:hypothetical protein